MGSGLRRNDEGGRRNDGCLSRYVRGAVRHTGAGRYPGVGDGFRPPPERRGGAPERRLPKPVRKGGRPAYRRRPVSRGGGWGMGSGLRRNDEGRRRNDGCLSRNDGGETPGMGAHGAGG